MGDYEAFDRVVEVAHDRVPLRLPDFTIMPNHWHFVVWPPTNAEVKVSSVKS